ncbi:peptidoglycan endopeptidase [Stenotrophomonas phage BUCT603]|nr:peptidoglycan endopeptidase [Stenotrophomonas phage BUCT603]
MRRALSEFFGYAYDADNFDCVDLTVAVQRKLFGREFSVPEDRREARRELRRLIRTYLERTDHPQDGDAVMMREAGRHKADHVGTWFMLGGEACVLHTTERTDTIITRVRQMSDLGLIIEGTYAWRI